MFNFGRLCFSGAKISSQSLGVARQLHSKPSLWQHFRSSGQRGPIGQMKGAIAIDKNKLVAAGLAAVGVGGLCVYGLVSSNSDNLSAMDKAVFWPDFVTDRIRSTYAYLAGSTVICAGSAYQFSKSVRFLTMMSGGIMPTIGMLIVSVGCGMVCQMIPYPEDGSAVNGKHLAWIVYSTSLGAMLAPLCLVGGSIITQAALYTGGIVGGLSLVGACAPSDKFLYMGGPLAMGLGVVFVSSIGTLFANPMTRLGMGMHAVSLYGGLLLFSGFLLYDTQKVVHQAETHPRSSLMRPFDPINHSIHILLDTINIFVRLVTILSGSQKRK